MIFDKVSSSVTHVLAARTDIHSNQEISLVKEWAYFEKGKNWNKFSDFFKLCQFMCQLYKQESIAIFSGTHNSKKT